MHATPGHVCGRTQSLCASQGSAGHNQKEPRAQPSSCTTSTLHNISSPEVAGSWQGLHDGATISVTDQPMVCLDTREGVVGWCICHVAVALHATLYVLQSRHTCLSPGSHGTGDAPPCQTDVVAVVDAAAAGVLHIAAAGATHQTPSGEDIRGLWEGLHGSNKGPLVGSPPPQHGRVKHFW
jgi:hypothetical protein